MRFKSIASGSNGNCIYIGNDRTHVLVDTGISCKRILQGLMEAEISAADLSGICITHEHSDHIQGLKVLLKKAPVPVYATEGTIQAILSLDKTGELDHDLFVPVVPGETFTVGDLTAETIHVSHDAAEPSAYRFTDGKKSAAVMTDLGIYTQKTIDFLKGVNGILLEANHDIRMLEVGHYPYPLKRRILGDFGHLSNEMSGRLLNEILHDDLKFALLGHLSEENNFPDLCFMGVTGEIDALNRKYRSSDFDIQVALRTASSPLFEI